jgi:pentatricopeptide repeat protein
MILGYVKCGQGQKALALYGEMQREGVQPDPYTFVGVLSACARVEALEEGRLIHEQIIRCGCESNVFLGNSLIDMYAKCRSMEDAGRVFGMMHTRNIVAWTSMILGHVKCGEGQKALALSHQMQQEGVRPDPVNFVAVLNACASVAALEEGRYVHKQIIQSGFESDFFVGSGLIDMYSKCGSIEDAQRVFNTMPKHDAVCWTAMLGGYAMHGHAKQALRHFKQIVMRVLKSTV